MCDVVIKVGDITAHLTAEQVEVMQLIAQGMTYDEIGRELGRSRRSVCYHVQAVKDKLGTDSARVALVTLEGAGVLK